MRLDDLRESENVDDRRKSSGARLALGGGLGTVVLILLALFFGVDPSALLQNTGQIQTRSQGDPSGIGAPSDPQDDARASMVRKILGTTEDVWREQFAKAGRRYEDPTLVLFRDRVQSKCGFASAASGPFYCPGDHTAYLDLSFFDELDRRLGAPGDFAQAYVVAHEIGHHVQNLLGLSDQVHDARGRLSEAEYNQLSVRLELQADFLAGVWAHHANKERRILEPGDIEEGLRAASAIGDDRLQMQGRGYVVPDSFTHGTSAQRVKWFRKGFETGDMRQGDTFSVASP